MSEEDLATRVTRIEKRQDALEKSHQEILKFIATELDYLGDYKNRTDSELSNMNGKIDLLTRIAEVHQATFEYQEDRDRAKAINRRLKNHQTRIKKEENNRNTQ